MWFISFAGDYCTSLFITLLVSLEHQSEFGFPFCCMLTTNSTQPLRPFTPVMPLGFPTLVLNAKTRRLPVTRGSGRGALFCPTNRSAQLVTSDPSSVFRVCAERISTARSCPDLGRSTYTALLCDITLTCPTTTTPNHFFCFVLREFASIITYTVALSRSAGPGCVQSPHQSPSQAPNQLPPLQ